MSVRGAARSAASIRMRRKAAGSVKVVAAVGAPATGELRVRALSAKVPWRRRSARRPSMSTSTTVARGPSGKRSVVPSSSPFS